MIEKQYFVTHSGDGCICDSISRELEDGVYEELTYHDIVDRLNELSEENQKLKETLIETNRELIIETMSLKNYNVSDNQRITELTNHVLVEFIKSKGYTLEEVSEFVTKL